MIRDEFRESWEKQRSRLYKFAAEEVSRVQRRLPPDLRDRAESIPVGFEDTPSADLVDDGVDSDLMGVFVGHDFAESGESPCALPPRIVLFLENIWDEAEACGEVFIEEVRRTYLHEVGHYLGLDEGELFDRDLD